MFLLSLAQLSSYTCIVGDNLFKITGSLGGYVNESKHAIFFFFPYLAPDR